jgi:hypothetical protein
MNFDGSKTSKRNGHDTRLFLARDRGDFHRIVGDGNSLTHKFREELRKLPTWRLSNTQMRIGIVPE